MSSDWLFFLFCIAVALFVQGVFSFFEMASVSLSKIRLQYYVSLGDKRALQLRFLLKKPSRLFGTTLVGIHAALQIGSECSRRFYESLHLNPDWAPVSQLLLIMVFAELSPIFAAMRHPEQAAMSLVPAMAGLAKILSPVIRCFDALSCAMHRWMGGAKDVSFFLSSEEVKMAIGMKEQDEFNATASQIFHLKNLSAKEIMAPLAKMPMVPSGAMLPEIRHLLDVHDFSFLAVYHRVIHNVVGIVYLRDLLRMEEGRKIMEYARSPWFVAQSAPISSILDQFRRNNQGAAVILDASGRSCGILTLDAILAQIFGSESMQSMPPEFPRFYIERTLSGDMSAAQFTKEFQVQLPALPEETLSELIVRSLGALPNRGDHVKIGFYLFTVVEPSLRGVRSLTVCTESH